MNATHDDTRRERAMRQAKADRLATTLIAAGWDGTTTLGDDAWAIATQAAGVRAPSDRTKDLVAYVVRERLAAAADPFEGLA